MARARARDELGRDSTDLLLQAAVGALAEAQSAAGAMPTHDAYDRSLRGRTMLEKVVVLRGEPACVVEVKEACAISRC